MNVECCSATEGKIPSVIANTAVGGVKQSVGLLAKDFSAQ